MKKTWRTPTLASLDVRATEYGTFQSETELYDGPQFPYGGPTENPPSGS